MANVHFFPDFNMDQCHKHGLFKRPIASSKSTILIIFVTVHKIFCHIFDSLYKNIFYKNVMLILRNTTY